MSATVLGCGHASQLMEVNSIRDSPQIHLHFLTEEGEEKGQVEICCHGCGTSLLMYYHESSTRLSRYRTVRDDFIRQHVQCPNRQYQRSCPNYRSKFAVVDLRPKRRSLSEQATEDSAYVSTTLTHDRAAGQSRHGRGPQETTRRRRR